MTEETRDAYFAAMRGAYRSGNQDGCVHAAEDKARRESLESLLRDSYNALIANAQWIAELHSLVEELEELYNAAKKLYEETGGDPFWYW